MKNMRRKDRQMSEDQAIKILESGEYGILSTVSSEGNPYGIPLSYAVENSSIYFHGATEGSKLDNIISNPNVCFTVVGKTQVLPEKFSTEYESVVVFGKAIILEGEDKVKPLKLLIKKYSPGFENEGEEYVYRSLDKTKVIKIEIDVLTGKHRV